MTVVVPAPSDAPADLAGPQPSAAPSATVAVRAAPERRTQLLLRVLGALVAGGGLTLAFPPLDLWPLAALTPPLLTLAVRGTRARRAGWLALLTGLAWLVPSMAWLRPVGTDAWLALALAEAVLFALVGPLLMLAARSRWWWLSTPALWVAGEALRGRQPFGGYPWSRVGFSQADGPFTAWASVGGVPLLGFVVLLAGCAVVAAALALRSGRHGLPRAGALLALAAALPVAGALIPTPTAPQGPGPATLEVAAVQGNVPRLGLDFDSQRAAVLDNHLAETATLAAGVAAGARPRPAVVLWPENSSDVDPLSDPAVAAELSQASAAVGAPIIVGAIVDGPTATEAENAALVWTAQGFTGARYVKRHPVPFGEYLPYRAQLTKLIKRFGRIPRDFVHGRQPGLLDVAGVRLGDLICFDVGYDASTRQLATGGARLLLVQTNSATFTSAETEQQLGITRVRAVEHGRSAVTVATSGVSAMVRPDGSVISETRTFTPALLQAALPLRSALTLADRVGGWPELVIVALGLLGVLVPLAPSRRRQGGRRSRRTAGVGTPLR